MFIEISDGFYNTEDIRWIQKCGSDSITIAFKGENDINAIDIEFDNGEERNKEWDKIKSQIAYGAILQMPSDYKNPFYVSNDNTGVTPV